MGIAPRRKTILATIRLKVIPMDPMINVLVINVINIQSNFFEKIGSGLEYVLSGAYFAHEEHIGTTIVKPVFADRYRTSLTAKLKHL